MLEHELVTQCADMTWLRRVLDAGVPLMQHDVNGLCVDTLLHRMAARGYLPALEVLVEERPILVNTYTMGSRYVGIPLQYAIQHRQVAATKVLLDATLFDRTRLLLLLDAVQSGSMGLVQLLYGRAVHMNQRELATGIVLRASIQYDEVEILQWLVAISGVTPSSVLIDHHLRQDTVEATTLAEDVQSPHVLSYLLSKGWPEPPLVDYWAFRVVQRARASVDRQG